MVREICKFFIFVTSFHYSLTIEVTIEQGILSGASYSSRNGKPFYGFTKIPFAKPPVGDLRFEPPQPAEPWKGVRDATELTPLCIQGMFSPDEFLGVGGQEDCLYLNVYTPMQTSKNKLLPVMVYIHGGGFYFGGSVFYDPKYFMDHDVIIVTINYRLHILGFLSAGDNIVSANNGMKDQTLALKWVQKNIAAFGGNPNDVTIFGVSAGGSSVAFHTRSPLSKGLFHKAIIESGTDLTPWALVLPELARERAFALGTLTTCLITNSQELVKCLKKVPVDELIVAHRKFFVWDEEPIVSFSIVPEPENVKEAFVTDKSLYGDETTSVPWIIGNVPNEGAFKVVRYLHENGDRMNHVVTNYKRVLPISLLYGYWIASKERTEQVTELIQNFYTGKKKFSSETWRDVLNLYSDALFTISTIESAKRHTNTTYFYYYDHRNEISLETFYGNIEGENLGACHGDETFSLFHLRDLYDEVNSGDDLKVSERVVKYWVNFATTGNTDPSGVWTTTKSGPVDYLHITTNKDEMKAGLLEERYQFWKKLNVFPPFQMKRN